MLDHKIRFMESEVELDVAIKQLQVIAATPELYGDFLKLNALQSLLGLLQHENSDIANDVVDLLRELTEADAVAENPDAVLLVDTLVR